MDRDDDDSPNKNRKRSKPSSPTPPKSKSTEDLKSIEANESESSKWRSKQHLFNQPTIFSSSFCGFDSSTRLTPELNAYQRHSISKSTPTTPNASNVNRSILTPPNIYNLNPTEQTTSRQSDLDQQTLLNQPSPIDTIVGFRPVSFRQSYLDHEPSFGANLSNLITPTIKPVKPNVFTPEVKQTTKTSTSIKIPDKHFQNLSLRSPSERVELAKTAKETLAKSKQENQSSLNKPKVVKGIKTGNQPTRTSSTQRNLFGKFKTNQIIKKSSTQKPTKQIETVDDKKITIEKATKQIETTKKDKEVEKPTKYSPFSKTFLSGHDKVDECKVLLKVLPSTKLDPNNQTRSGLLVTNSLSLPRAYQQAIRAQPTRVPRLISPPKTLSPQRSTDKESKARTKKENRSKERIQSDTSKLGRHTKPKLSKSNEDNEFINTTSGSSKESTPCSTKSNKTSTSKSVDSGKSSTSKKFSLRKALSSSNLEYEKRNIRTIKRPDYNEESSSDLDRSDKSDKKSPVNASKDSNKSSDSSKAGEFHSQSTEELFSQGTYNVLMKEPMTDGLTVADMIKKCCKFDSCEEKVVVFKMSWLLKEKIESILTVISAKRHELDNKLAYQCSDIIDNLTNLPVINDLYKPNYDVSSELKISLLDFLSCFHYQSAVVRSRKIEQLVNKSNELLETFKNLSVSEDQMIEQKTEKDQMVSGSTKNEACDMRVIKKNFTNQIKHILADPTGFSIVLPLANLVSFLSEKNFQDSEELCVDSLKFFFRFYSRAIEVVEVENEKCKEIVENTLSETPIIDVYFFYNDIECKKRDRLKFKPFELEIERTVLCCFPDVDRGPVTQNYILNIPKTTHPTHYFKLDHSIEILSLLKTGSGFVVDDTLYIHFRIKKAVPKKADADKLDLKKC